MLYELALCLLEEARNLRAAGFPFRLILVTYTAVAASFEQISRSRRRHISRATAAATR